MNEKEAYQLANAIADRAQAREENRIYAYATVPLSVVVGMMKVPVPKDSYLSKDSETTAVHSLLERGFRWVRTDGEWAVFELTKYRDQCG